MGSPVYLGWDQLKLTSSAFENPKVAILTYFLNSMGQKCANVDKFNSLVRLGD